MEEQRFPIEKEVTVEKILEIPVIPEMDEDFKVDVELQKAATETQEDIASSIKRLIDYPTVFKIGDKEYIYTSRPIGYFNLIFQELVNLGSGIEEILLVLMGKKSVEGADETNLASDLVRKHFTKNGEKGIDAMIRITQLLVEPIDVANPRPPDTNNMYLSKDVAQWVVTPDVFVAVLSNYVRTDLESTGDALKNLLSLGQT